MRDHGDRIGNCQLLAVGTAGAPRHSASVLKRFRSPVASEMQHDFLVKLLHRLRKLVVPTVSSFAESQSQDCTCYGAVIILTNTILMDNM